MLNIDALDSNYNKWLDPYLSVRETREGLKEVRDNYDKDYKEAFHTAVIPKWSKVPSGPTKQTGAF